jgi:hypothetical protein
VGVRRKEVEVTKEVKSNKKENGETDHAGMREWKEITNRRSSNQGRGRE